MPDVILRDQDALSFLSSLTPNSAHAIVTDPPYGLSFMDSEWDAQIPSVEVWAEALQTLKPGGYLLAFGGTRTFHRQVCRIEDAGFEVLDHITWLYGQGYPKSHNQHGRWLGWGTALKPGWEPITVARRPLAGTVRENLLGHGCGALHIDAARIPVSDAQYSANCSRDRGHSGTRETGSVTDIRTGGGSASDIGRWPANVALDETAAAMLDEQTGVLKSGANPRRRASAKHKNTSRPFEGQKECSSLRLEDAGGASRFFYCAKASRRERDLGCEQLPERLLKWGHGGMGGFQSEGTKESAKNPWPTVKPIALMRWLIRLVAPPGALIVDPFLGSGTTGVAAVLEGVNFAGCDSNPIAMEIARERIGWARHQRNGVPA